MEDLYKIVFASSLEPQFILDKSTHKFVDANDLFQTISGYTKEELVDCKSWTQLVSDPQMSTVFQKRSDVIKTEIRLKTKDGNLVPVELKLKPFNKTIVIGYIRDLTEKKQYVESAWEKIEEIVKSNSRLGILKEKLEAMQELARALLSVKTIGQVFEQAAAFMRRRDKLGYTRVTFYMKEKDSLYPSYSTHKAKKIKLDDGGPVCNVFLEKIPIFDTTKELIAPLKGKEGNIGIMEVHFPVKELESLSGNDVAIRGYKDIVIAVSEIIALIVENIKLYDEIFQQSIIDPLTGLYNRRYFDSKLEEEIRRTTRYNRPLGIIMCDVNEFKQINDTYGHKQGDKTLQELSDIIKNSSRLSDIVVRYGGDEFIILMPETNYENTSIKAKHLSEQVSKTEFTNIYSKNDYIHMSIAIGCGEYKQGLDADDFVKVIDQAMYKDKQKYYDMTKGEDE